MNNEITNSPGYREKIGHYLKHRGIYLLTILILITAVGILDKTRTNSKQDSFHSKELSNLNKGK
jgi:membrane-bound acyltransferase YfiQ involved in biofilm formation